ncbi:hypothetical protein M0R45_024339 [Rubus argutus]|uniref:SnoaL-like domain-containing protein n=1 Tax=Rubus argutus TaxID=59490 RepID=A0AAW1WSS6_RUBAR
MATVVNFSSIAPSQRMCLKPMAGPAIDSLTINRTCRFVQQNRTDTKQHISYMKRKGEDKLSANVRGLFPIMATTTSSTFSPGSHSPSDTIHEFYDCINHKNLKQLGHYISRDCYIEECSFSTPIRGKKEVMNFFEQLTAAMGQNVKFSIKHVCEGDDQLIAAANWHMEWKDKQIPFTRGCSFFECSREEEKLIIKKAQIVIESTDQTRTPSTVTTLFDGFPRATEWFLKELFNTAIRLLSFVYNILLYIANMFFK